MNLAFTEYVFAQMFSYNTTRLIFFLRIKIHSLYKIREPFSSLKCVILCRDLQFLNISLFYVWKDIRPPAQDSDVKCHKLKDSPASESTKVKFWETSTLACRIRAFRENTLHII